MVFGTAKDKDASNRFMMFRLEPARHISGDLALVSGVYEMTFADGPVSRVQRLGVNLTADATTPTVNDHYYYNETTGKLQIKLASAPNATTNTIVAFFYLFYTGEKTRYEAETPTAAVSASNPLREWQPKIASYPGISQTSRNITSGIMTIADTSIDIINTDFSLQAYLGPEYSFSNKSCLIWLAIDDVSAIDLVYSGKCKSISVGTSEVSIDINDPFVVLSQPAYMGDSADEVYFRRKTGSFPSLNPSDHDKVCPYIIGAQSRGLVKSSYQFASLLTYGIPQQQAVVDANQAYCINFSPEQSNAGLQSVNPDWGCCRIPATGLRTQVFGTIVRSHVDGGFGFKHYYIPGHNLQIGQTVLYNDGTARYDIVSAVDTFQISSQDYNLTTYGPSTTAATSFTAHAAPSVFVLPPGFSRPIPLFYQQHYTYTLTTTSGGNKFLKISIVRGASAPEYASFWLVGAARLFGTAPDRYINPDKHRVMYIAYKADEETHAEALQDIVERTGITVDSSSITQADSDLTANARFQVPEYDQTDYSDYRYYAEQILASTIGLLKINSSNQAVYEVISAPASTDVTDSGIYVDKSLSVKIDYNDIKTEMIGYNPHIVDENDVDGSTDIASASASNPTAKYLHGIDVSERFRHVLDRIDNRIADHVSLKSSRKASYKFKTATKHLDTLIGDDIQLDSNIVLGGSGSVDLKVTKITKDGNTTAIEAEDLEGL